MAWDKPDDAIIAFECDTCSTVEDVEIEKARLGSTRPDAPAFSICWDYLRSLGWQTFKRTGHDWTHACVKCAVEAGLAHQQHRRDERDRERAKARNEAASL